MIPISGHALSVQIAVPQIAITAHPKARTCAWLIPGTDIRAGIQLEHTITPDTVLEQKFVARLATISPMTIVTMIGIFATTGPRMFCRHRVIP